jgi:hypothetical protein
VQPADVPRAGGRQFLGDPRAVAQVVRRGAAVWVRQQVQDRDVAERAALVPRRLLEQAEQVGGVIPAVVVVHSSVSPLSESLRVYWNKCTPYSTLI